MKKFVIFFALATLFFPQVFATETIPLQISVIEYGIFDPNGNNTTELKIGEKYHIKTHLMSEREESFSFTIAVQVIDKNGYNVVIEEYSDSKVIHPHGSQIMSFDLIPKYEGNFRIMIEVTDTNEERALAEIPQFDFEVSRGNPNYAEYYPVYKIIDLENRYNVGDTILPKIYKKDINTCNSYTAELIKDRETIWRYTSHSSCLSFDNTEEIESIIIIPKNGKAVSLNEAGEYYLRVEMSNVIIQDHFSVREKIHDPEFFRDGTNHRVIPFVFESIGGALIIGFIVFYFIKKRKDKQNE